VWKGRRRARNNPRCARVSDRRGRAERPRGLAGRGAREAMDEQTVLNGIDVQAFESALEAVGARPEAARAPKTSRVRWLDGLKFRASVRGHTFLVDEPSHLSGEDTSPNSVEYVLGAY